MAATQMSDGEEEKSNNGSAWEALLRRMLPPGAPLPDEDHLDYSFAVEYQGPLPSQPLPEVNPLNMDASTSIAAIASSLISMPSFSDFNSTSKAKTASKAFYAANVAKEFQFKVNGNESDSRLHSINDCDSNSLFSLQLDSRSENLEVRAEGMLSNSCFNGNENDKDDEGKRVKTVKFNPDDDDDDDDDDDGDNGEGDGVWSQCSSIASLSPVGGGEGKQRRKKRGLCSRCGKGNRLSEREMCIVCDAKYCKCCVLKAMGSMPEGRKCVSCIGKPIDESKRPFLGKFSKFLKKVCSPLEVKQIIKAEKECFANQLRPGQLVVNGRELVPEELVELLGCSLPPLNLKPGKYWYDKDSGLWGKEGEKPDRIISSKLNVGGKLQANSSNGNTKVFFNGREITKLELRVLKLAKVQCSQDTHFWVYDDGSYEEEGQNKIKGNIWEKTSTRILSSLLSLPVPPGKFNGVKRNSTACSGLEQGKIHKLLLLGLRGSGTSTIFKQAKLIYGDSFTAEELEKIKFLIQSNLYKYLGTLLEGRESFEEEALMTEIDTKHAVVVDAELSGDQNNQCIYSLNSRLKKHADWLLEIMASGDVDAFFPAATREYAPIVEELWRDGSMQETYRRKKELHFLPEAAKYFLDRAVEISSNDYEPSEKDIIYAGGVTQSNSLASLEFPFGDRSPISDLYEENLEHLPLSTKYQLVHMNSCGLHEGCKWLDMFEDVRAVLFCVALSDYDELWPQTTDYVCNKMVASKEMFERLVTHPSFSNMPFILLLNKYDTFEEKISHVPLTVCEWFGDFCPVKLHSNSQSLAQQAYYYVAVKFKELYAAITGCKLYVWQTRALERASVDEAFSFVHEVLKWDDMRDENLYDLLADDSFYSTEVSSYVGEG